jgi:hypothetical protein
MEKMNHTNIAISNRKKLIVVLGMHRSGTSAITRGLLGLGVQLGNRLIPPIEGNNDKGFWEDIDINHLNYKILETINKEWHYFVPIKQEEIEFLRQKGYFERAVAMMRQKVADSTIYGIKDPRISILLPFWKEVFKSLNYDVSYIIAVRHPLSVAKSLEKRDGFDFEKSYFLWLTHVINSLSGTTGCNRIVIDYDKLMQNTEKELRRVADVLHLEVDTNELGIYKADFLDEKLRHTSYTSADLKLDNASSELLKDVYSTLMDLSITTKIDDEVLIKELEKYEYELAKYNQVLILADKLTDKIAVLNHIISKDNIQINTLHQELFIQLENIAQKNEELNKTIEEQLQKDKELNQKTEALLQKDKELNQKTEALLQKDKELNQILNSKSWRLTFPFRFIHEFYRDQSKKQILIKIVWYINKFVYHLLPLKNNMKERLKQKFFKNFKGLFKAIKGIEIESFPSEDVIIDNALILKNVNRIIQFTPFVENKPLLKMPIKILAFYLPQFHAIPENDNWWGKGFTEWTNVKPAKPLFEGHYQPHIPVTELGYYNLLDLKTQEFQVELAKNYGVGGFCFHFYWFNGKTLLEKPIENYLKNKQLDLPFCLSWANENWTRRWDGMENEILIKQHHSSEDDLAFIEHVSMYMKDKRYIRIDGKPLLMVYRPGLLPSANKTAERWRKWCKNNGIGEIYLANVESFEKINPEDIGYDAAVEFPPNPFKLVNFTQIIKPFDKEFNATVYDWKSVQNVSENYDIPEYKLFRCVCPSWDNTARRKNESRIFFNNHPDDFKDWVYNAGIDTIKRFENTDERLIFVNAWNEWAEGAHLEPDEKYGYAYLQNIYDSLKELSKL